MNIQPLTGRPFVFACIRCGARVQSSAPGTAADLDGIPWQAYYCPPCAQVRRAERARADIVQGPIVEVRA